MFDIMILLEPFGLFFTYFFDFMSSSEFSRSVLVIPFYMLVPVTVAGLLRSLVDNL